MTETLQILLRSIVVCACPTALLFAMSGFKCRRKVVWMVYSVIVIAGAAICAALIFTAGVERMRQLYFLILMVPSLLFLLLATKDKPFQILFNFFTAVNAIYLTSILSHFALGVKEEPIWADALIRMAIFALLLYLFTRRLREPYRFIADNMQSGWRAIATLPFLFFALVMFLGLYPHIRTDNLMAVVFLYVILCMVYYVIYQVFRSTYTMLKVRSDNETLQTQILAFSGQAEALRRNEEQIRIYRHDMRHYIAQVSMLLQDGKTEAALQILGDFDQLAKKTKLPSYCENTTVNAILSFYYIQAQESGIQIDSNCSIPQALSIEPLELAMVVANALENAITACKKLPEQDRRISVLCISRPQFVLEISNTYDGHAQFDENHLPVTDKDGHGIGTRSILAFAKKHRAVIDYKADGALFQFRLLLSDH